VSAPPHRAPQPCSCARPQLTACHLEAARYLSATEAMWLTLGFNMYNTFPPVNVMAMHTHDSLNGDADAGVSDLTKYMHRPAGVDDVLFYGSAPAAVAMFDYTCP